MGRGDEGDVMFYFEVVDLNEFKARRYLFNFIDDEWEMIDEPSVFDTVSYAIFETPEEFAVKH